MFGTATSPVPPAWFKQRQGKAEPVNEGEALHKLTAPNQQDAYVLIQQHENGKWLAELRETADGESLSITPAVLDNPGEAWNAAFELYRQNIIV